MATIKYSLDKEDKHYEVVQAAGSAVTKEVELTLEDSLTKQEKVVALQQIIEHIVRNTA